jgi:hypothetical protein
MNTFETGLDNVFKPFWTAWQAGATTIVGYIPDVQWHGTEEGQPHERSKFWARGSQKVLESSQATFRSATSQHRLTTYGTVYVQVFCPFTATKAATLGRRLAVLVRNAYTGKESGGVWFRNPKIVERPTDKDWFQLVVSVDYTFDELVS